MSGSLTIWLNPCIQKHQFIQERPSDSVYGSLNRVLKQFIQKYWFVLEQNKCMSLWVSQWIIHTADLLKNNTDPFWNKTNEWVNQRIIHRMDLFKHTDSVK